MASFEKLRILIFWANLHKFLLWNFYAENFQTYQAFCWNEFKSIAIRQRLLKCSAYVNWEIWMKLKIKIPHSIKQSNRNFGNRLALKSNYLMTVNISCILAFWWKLCKPLFVADLEKEAGRQQKNALKYISLWIYTTMTLERPTRWCDGNISEFSWRWLLLLLLIINAMGHL